MDLGHLRAGAILSEVFSSIVDLELPILRTTCGLLTAPGRTAARWIGGQRKSYTNPIKYCVIMGILYTLFTRLHLSHDPALNPLSDSQVQYTLSSAAQDYIAFVLMLLAVPFGPIAGLLSRLFKVPRRAIEWYALFLYCLGISLLLQMLASLISPALANYSSLLPAVFILWGGWQFGDTQARWRPFCAAFCGLILWGLLLMNVQQLIVSNG